MSLFLFIHVCSDFYENGNVSEKTILLNVPHLNHQNPHPPSVTNYISSQRGGLSCLSAQEALYQCEGPDHSVFIVLMDVFVIYL